MEDNLITDRIGVGFVAGPIDFGIAYVKDFDLEAEGTASGFLSSTMIGFLDDSKLKSVL